MTKTEIAMKRMQQLSPAVRREHRQRAVEAKNRRKENNVNKS